MTARVAVLSSTEFGRRCVEEAVLNAPACTLVGVLTTGQEIPISYAPRPIRIATHARFDRATRLAACPVVTLEGRATTALTLEILRQWRPDLLLVLGWYYLVPAAVRQAAPLGCLGIHSSLLPKYRGGAPIPWAIINGEITTGVTLFHLEDEVDAGDIVAQRAVPIGPLDTCADVIASATDASVDLLTATLPALASGRAQRVPQLHQLATVMPQRSPADGLIDWSRDVTTVHNFIRAQTRPYDGAFTFVGRERLTIWAAAPDVAGPDGPAGTVIASPGGDALLVSCGNGRLGVTEVGFPDGRSVRGRSLVTAIVKGTHAVFGSHA